MMMTVSRVAAASAIVTLAVALGSGLLGARLLGAGPPGAGALAAGGLRTAPAPTPAGAARPLELSVRPASGSVNSLNSTGYAVSRSGTRFRSVRATFFVPYLNCSLSKGASSSDWVGLDGFVGQPDSVEQAGIVADCSSAGHASYHAWHAMYPAARVRSRITVRGGDSITARVSFDLGDRKFTLALTDNTTGAHFLVRPSCHRGVRCPRNSAEVISSAPSSGPAGHVKIAPLADYGAVSLAAISIKDRSGQRGGLRSPHWGATKIVQTEQAAPFRLIARPTPIQTSAFDNYWSRAR
jgi:Peptidase A4 family